RQAREPEVEVGLAPEHTLGAAEQDVEAPDDLRRGDRGANGRYRKRRMWRLRRRVPPPAWTGPVGVLLQERPERLAIVGTEIAGPVLSAGEGGDTAREARAGPGHRGVDPGNAKTSRDLVDGDPRA